jgi:hypothetical protein
MQVDLLVAPTQYRNNIKGEWRALAASNSLLSPQSFSTIFARNEANVIRSFTRQPVRRPLSPLRHTRS